MTIDVLLVAACLITLCSICLAQETELDAAPPYAVWPIPREMELRPKRLLLTDACIVVPKGDEKAQFPGRLLSRIIADQFMVAIPVVTGAAPAGKTAITVGEISDPIISAAAAGKITASEPGADGYACGRC